MDISTVRQWVLHFSSGNTRISNFSICANFYKYSMQALHCWLKCIANGGEFVDKDCFAAENLCYQIVLQCFVVVSMEINGSLYFGSNLCAYIGILVHFFLIHMINTNIFVYLNQRFKRIQIILVVLKNIFISNISQSTYAAHGIYIHKFQVSASNPIMETICCNVLFFVKRSVSMGNSLNQEFKTASFLQDSGLFEIGDETVLCGNIQALQLLELTRQKHHEETYK